MSERSLNKVQLIGRIGSDCELKFTPSGKARTNFSVATGRRWKPKDSQEWKEETEWSRCVLWDSEALSAYLLKGTHVFIEGSLRTRKYQETGSTKDRYITEILVLELILLGSKRAGAGEQEPVRAPRGQQERLPVAGAGQVADESGLGITDDDVPF
jgi:single-strand DNA-binding protein